jgi:hypothetical protein
MTVEKFERKLKGRHQMGGGMKDRRTQGNNINVHLKQISMEWNGLNWLRTGSNGGLF